MADHTNYVNNVSYAVPPSDPYELRAYNDAGPMSDFEATRSLAIQYYRKRFMIILLIATPPQGVLLIDEYFYSTAVSLFMIFFGLLAGYKSHAEGLFVYMVLAFLNIVKDIGLFIGYAHSVLTISMVVLDFLLTPMGMYFAFYFRQCIHMVPVTLD